VPTSILELFFSAQIAAIKTALEGKLTRGGQPLGKVIVSCFGDMLQALSVAKTRL
jgi:hypothetical protein